MIMEVIRSLEDCQRQSNSVITIGTFDGIHRAHQTIIDKVVTYAKEKRAPSTVVTFEPHPRYVVRKKANAPIGLLTTVEEKINLIEQRDVDRLIIIPFTEAFSKILPDEFIEQILFQAIGFQTLIIGFDHGFGKDRAGDRDFLKNESEKLNFDFIVQEPISNQSGIIASSKIRKLILDGEMECARGSLGRSYLISGTVIRGDGVGRKLNYPTANIKIDNEKKCLPPHGVYVVSVDLNGKKFQGVMNVGIGPTFNGKSTKLEVHILDFDEDIYNAKISVAFLKKIRNEKKFDSPVLLKQQIQKDVNIARSYIHESVV